MLQTIIAAELSINPNIDKLQTVGYLYGNNDLLDLALKILAIVAPIHKHSQMSYHW